jgi:peptidoglycan/xylan/chitin deacetylase (PgdA/CDA1 family)
MVRKLLFTLVLITFITSCSSYTPFLARPVTFLPIQSVSVSLPIGIESAPTNVPVLEVNPVSVPALAPESIASSNLISVPAIVPALTIIPESVPVQSDLTTELSDHITTRLPIIEYHYSTFNMGTGVRMETDWFLSQLAWLHDNDFQALTSDQLTGFVKGTYNPPLRSVVLTFDVGASKFDDYTNIVIPALRQYHLHAIFFILASRTVDSCDDPDQACWPMLKQWADEGLISVGSHSWSHIDYQTLTPEDIYRDAAHSKALVEEKTGHIVQGICYPFDSVNPAAFDLLKSLGYTFAVGGYTQADRSAHASADQPYNLPRYYPYSGEDYYPIIGGTHGQTFDQMLLGSIDQ